MANAKPGNANLPIGGRPNAIQQNSAPRWHSRGYLPHVESPEATQHVTFHLADSLPKTALLRLEAELKLLPLARRDVEHRKRLEEWIDAGHGSCVLRKSGIAAMVQDTLLSFDARRYRLLAWVVMPNHVHALFQPMDGWEVAKIVASWKKFTARKILDIRNANREIGVPRNTGAVWHREYWDRYIRSRAHLNRAIEYIHLNPVKAGLATQAEAWPWSSAFPGNANLPIGVVKP
jgi:putative transposase